MFKCPFELHVA